MSIFEALVEDHQRLRKILTDLQGTTERGPKVRQDLYDRLALILTTHASLEEKFLYDHIKDIEGLTEDTLEGFEEHKVTAKLLAEMGRADMATEEWGAKAKVIQELLAHHLKEEEEELFPRAGRSLDRALITELGEQYTSARNEMAGATRV